MGTGGISRRRVRGQRAVAVKGSGGVLCPLVVDLGARVWDRTVQNRQHSRTGHRQLLACE